MRITCWATNICLSTFINLFQILFNISSCYVNSIWLQYLRFCCLLTLSSVEKNLKLTLQFSFCYNFNVWPYRIMNLMLSKIMRLLIALDLNSRRSLDKCAIISVTLELVFFYLARGWLGVWSLISTQFQYFTSITSLFSTDYRFKPVFFQLKYFWWGIWFFHAKMILDLSKIRKLFIFDELIVGSKLQLIKSHSLCFKWRFKWSDKLILCCAVQCMFISVIN